ncbi:MAG: hypothetical protein ACXAB2_13755 [Candidatus Hodarchaeales archaeon]|jgi:DNA-binding HxlR family transcriptional regulator
MTDPQSKDVIIHQQALLIEITDEKIVKLFQNKNLMSILTLLREEKHLTFREIENKLDALFKQEFDGPKEEYKSKSSKSVYRYLKELENANLIIQSGKRVKPTAGKKVKSETLYSRTAKIFYPNSSFKTDSEKEKHRNPVFDQAVEFFLSRLFNKQLKSAELLHELLFRIKMVQVEYSISNLKNADEELVNVVSKLDWKPVNSFIDMVGILALLCDETDWKAKIQACFE